MAKVTSTSTKENLSSGPADMPSRGGPKPSFMTTSTQVEMGREASPVAQFGGNPGQGKVLTNNTKADLSREANSPYEGKGISKTMPQVPFGGRK